MSVLTDVQRRALDKAVQRAREVAEAAAREAVSRLAVDRESRSDYLSGEENDLRLALREKARLLGDDTGPRPELKLLIGDIAYEQWHRLLFARFLEVNGLLRHPDVPDVALTMDDCAELAAEEGELDGWSVAARYAETILPGVFRLSDPAVRLRFSPERRTELDAIVAELDRATLQAEDSLGWVYQFWQTAEKKRVNDSGRKVGGADLAPVTQLFTENYMVRFLLENSLGAWWAGRHPDSPLLAEWDHLRFLEDGTPAAGTFDEWPSTAAEVTVMDPCCGSGHFLVAAFGMLWRMRAEEEGLSPADAQDAVLRDNLFGLELDSRCTQIAAFNVVLEAWKQGGFHNVSMPQIASSGITLGQEILGRLIVEDNESLRAELTMLCDLFKDSMSLGSLVDPRRRAASPSRLPISDGLSSAQWGGIAVELAGILADHGSTSLSAHFSNAWQSVALLGRSYTLVATNVPFLSSNKQEPQLANHLTAKFGEAGADLATAMWTRWAASAATVAIVCPQTWRFLDAYRAFREELTASTQIDLLVSLGSAAFSTPMWDYSVGLQIFSGTTNPSTAYQAMTVGSASGIANKATALATAIIETIGRPSRPDFIVRVSQRSMGLPLAHYAEVIYGMKPGQTVRVTRFFWEVRLPLHQWLLLSSSPSGDSPYSGNAEVVMSPRAMDLAGVTEYAFSGTRAHGRQGVIFSKMGRLPSALYSGNVFDDNTYVLLPQDDKDLPALWHFASAPDFGSAVREINEKLAVPTGAVERARIDLGFWQRVAEENGPLPEPHSDDPTQWLFKGTIPNATEPLQVAVARLLGYRWPDQEPDDLDELADADGIVALPAVTGELDAATRLRALLFRAYGSEWSTQREQALIQQACDKRVDLAAWLRDEFFKQHTKVFHQRPFLWHIWDGCKDGFSAIINYHRLDRRTLEKLTFTVLGAWIEKQKTAAVNDVAGADLRLAAAVDLQRRLELILDGEAPYDIYVRWKTLAEQPIGWEPDLDDGVRLNIRPFVTAGVLRSKVNVSWRKDRGTNPDGTERLNDLHPSLAERRAARATDRST